VVERYDQAELILTAPLSANYNHLGTAFGGSLSSLAMMAGYSLVWMEIKDLECHVVIRDASIQYLKPVRTDLRAVCRRPEQDVIDEFKERFARTGKARITLPVTIEDADEIAMTFQGTFVAIQ